MGTAVALGVRCAYQKSILKQAGAAATPVHPWRVAARRPRRGLLGGTVGGNSSGAPNHTVEFAGADVGGQVGPASGKPWTRPPSPLGARTHFARTPRQRGNRVVTNKQFGRQSNACSQLGIHATFGTYVDFGIAKIGIAKIGALWRC